MSPTNHAPPFPALTTAQRWHLEVNGYVVVENVLGPDDGGTCIIAGCHKATCAEESIIQAAREDSSLIHQVVAPAGSTLIFCETLLHASGDIRSDKERTIIISGYNPWNQRTGTAHEFSAGFKEQVPEEFERLIFGSDLNPRLRRRSLDMPVGSADPGDYLDGFSLTSADPDSYESNHLTKSLLPNSTQE